MVVSADMSADSTRQTQDSMRGAALDAQLHPRPHLRLQLCFERRRVGPLHEAAAAADLAQQDIQVAEVAAAARSNVPWRPSYYEKKVHQPSLRAPHSASPGN